MKRIILFILIAISVSIGQYKQSYNSLYPSKVFGEYFNDEYSVRANSGVPTSVVYSQGSGVFNGSTSYLKINKALKGTYSLRLRVNLPATNSGFLLDFRADGGTGYLYYSGTTTLEATSGTVYVNGNVSTTTGTSTKEIVVSGISINAKTIYVGCRNTVANFVTASISEIEIYNRSLSSAEIKNLYDGVAHKDLTLTPLIDFNSTGGQIKSSVGNVWTASNATTKRAGSIFASSFNGTTSYLSTPNVNLSGNITVVGWFKMDNFGQNSLGNILNDTKLVVRVNSTNSVLQLSRDNSTYASSATNALQAGKVYLFACTSTSTGVTNLYLADAKSSVVISGTANQSAGTPANGSTILIGNNSTSSPTRTFKGIIPKVQVFGQILTLNQITQIWSNSVGGYYGD